MMDQTSVLTLSTARPSTPERLLHISLLLIDDEHLGRKGLVARLQQEPDFVVIASSVPAKDAVRHVAETHPDVVLLSLRQGGDDALTLAGALHGAAPASRVIVLGLQSGQPDVAALIRARVSGFLMARASFEELLDTVRLVAGGVQVLPPELTAPLFSQLQTHHEPARPRRLAHKQLTAREREVADLLVLGLSNKAIAGHLRIALPTVKGHVHRVLGKLDVSNRLKLASFSAARPAVPEQRQPLPFGSIRRAPSPITLTSDGGRPSV